MDQPGTNRFELAIQIALTAELGLIFLNAIFPGLAFLPLGGSEIAQVALIIIPALVVIEVCHWGRLCWRASRNWWRET